MVANGDTQHRFAWRGFGLQTPHEASALADGFSAQPRGVVTSSWYDGCIHCYLYHFRLRFLLLPPFPGREDRGLGCLFHRVGIVGRVRTLPVLEGEESCHLHVILLSAMNEQGSVGRPPNV